MSNKLHVNASKIRISIRPHGKLWTVKVQSRAAEELYISSTGDDPVDTMQYVLRKAAIDGMPGVSCG